MFGESETGESPRVPSPWDALTSDRESNSSPPLRLVQESDDGNIEYKLHLLNPSPGRFSRLVTQMKWRLLEGGGQAYYELGVADSGALIGLTREDLEGTLETLDSMAGELGASVIVVKEIEVLTGMTGLNAPGRRRRCCRLESSGESSSATETETEATTATDSEDDVRSPSPVICSHSLPSFGSPLPTMGLESTNPTLPSYSLPARAQSQTHLPVDLEIATVYKPRTTRSFTHRSTSARKVKPKSYFPKKQKYNQPHQFHNSNEISPVQSRAKQQEKVKARIIAHDHREDEKQAALAGIPVLGLGPDFDCSLEATFVLGQVKEQNQIPADEQISAQAQLVSDLQSLHVSLCVSPTLSSASHTAGKGSSPSIPVPTIDITSSPSSPSISPTTSCTFQNHSRKPQPIPNSGSPRQETRLIVEALVVRKLSLEEAYLDFGGFALT